MKISCPHCCCSGIYIIPNPDWPDKNTTGNIVSNALAVPCKYCNGTGYIDEYEMMSVPRKYVKDEYFEEAPK